MFSTTVKESMILMCELWEQVDGEADGGRQSFSFTVQECVFTAQAHRV